MTDIAMLENIDLDLSGIDTSRPVPVDCKVLATLVEISVDSTYDNTGQQLSLIWETNEPMTSIKAHEVGDSNDIPPGFKVRDSVDLQQSDHPQAPEFEKILSQYQDALLGTDINSRGQLRAAEWLGKQATISLKANPSKKDGTLYTNVRYVEPPVN